MNYPTSPYYSGSYDPCGRYYTYDPCCYAPSPVVCYVPVPCAPAPAPCCTPYPMTVPHELAADAASSPQEALVGGKCEVHLSIEYLVDTPAPPAPKVTVTVTSDGSTSTWTDTGIASGYHVKEGFLTVQPGSKVKLEVTDALARLRWCETICC